MKRFIYIPLALLVFVLSSCQGNTEKKKNITSTTTEVSNDNSSVMSFEKVVHDFGSIKEGEIVETVFNFTNSGTADLIILDARGSCGCTIPEYPKNEPIAPGETGVIRVSFDSSNKPNMQQKAVTLTTNTKSGREILRIQAMVQPDPVKQQQRDRAAAARRQQNN
jgi:hypothetical protein